MALVNVGWVSIPWMNASSYGPRPKSYTLDASGEKIATVFDIRNSGSITHICFGVRDVTTGGTLEVSLETVDTSTGYPSGTLWGTGTNGSQVVADTDSYTWFEIALTNSATVAAGDILAIVIANSTASPGNMNIPYEDQGSSGSTYYPERDFPYRITYDPGSASWAKAAGPLNFALKYSDGSYYVPVGVSPAYHQYEGAWYNVNDGYRGLRFKLPIPVRVIGFWMNHDRRGDSNVKLFDSDGATVLREVFWDVNIQGSDTAPRAEARMFSSPVVLSANTFYRLAIQPLDTNYIRIYEAYGLPEGVLDAWEVPDFHATGASSTPTGESSWTNYTTRRPAMGLIIDQLDDGTGGGGGSTGGLLVHPGMSGGMRG